MNKIEEIEALINRANEQLAEIVKMLTLPHQANIPANYVDSKSRREFFEEYLDKLAVQIRLRIGEFANSLRSPLNYVACAFADQDSHRVGKLVQFPIEDDPKVFKGRRTTYLEGISDPHIALIERCQPYSGWKCMEFLRDFSNFYKHHGLVIVHQKAEYISVIRPQSDAESREPKFAVVFDSWRDDSGVMQVKPSIPVSITLPDGTPIMQVLEEIQRGVTLMLRDFESHLR
jgi:hypothetical protein